MSALKAVNVTKYDAGGSGDNVIPDGYIKSVEKVWLDYYTFTATAIATNDTIAIAKVPPGKKITSIEVYFPAITPTNATINIGTADSAARFVSAASLITSPQVVRMSQNAGLGYVTTGSTPSTIYLAIGTVAVTAPTAGTIYTIVRYV